MSQPRLEVRGGQYVLSARESRYGTFLDGEAVTQCELRSGDRVRLGRGAGADLVFFTGEEPLVCAGGRPTTGQAHARQPANERRKEKRMDEKQLFTHFWTNESKTTRNVLARIPEVSDYRPDAKSRTAQEIAWHIVCEEKMIIEALENGKAEWVPPPMRATMKEVLEPRKQSAG